LTALPARSVLTPVTPNAVVSRHAHVTASAASDRLLVIRIGDSLADPWKAFAETRKTPGSGSPATTSQAASWAAGPEPAGICLLSYSS
jgi:hypothetical protein